MNPIVISCLISAALIVSSCNGSVHSDPNSKDYASNNYKSKAKIIETFINIDYESAYEIAVKQTEDNQTFNADVLAIHSECSTPWMLYLLNADCSLCIAAALDFMQSFCHLRLDFETPVIALKEGDKEIFDFYKEKLLSQDIDAKTIDKLQKFHVVNINSDYHKNLKDGIYLIYRNHIVNYMHWPSVL